MAQGIIRLFGFKNSVAMNGLSHPIRAAVALGLVAAFAGAANAGANDLRLWVDVEGTAYLTNPTDGPVSFDGYQIVSEQGLLDPASWDSISDRIPARINELITPLGAGSLTFGEANPTAFSLAELNLGNVATLPAHGKFSLGKPFKSIFDYCSVEGFFWSAPGTGAQQPDIFFCPEPSPGHSGRSRRGHAPQAVGRREPSDRRSGARNDSQRSAAAALLADVGLVAVR